MIITDAMRERARLQTESCHECANLLIKGADEIRRLRAAFRVNGLRWGHTHAEIDAILDPPVVTTGYEK